MSGSVGNHVGRRDRACNARLLAFPITPLDNIWRDLVQKIITRLLARGHLETKRTKKNAPKNTVQKRGKPTAKQPPNTPSRDRAIKGIRQPFEGVPAVSFGKGRDTNTEKTDKAKCLMQRRLQYISTQKQLTRQRFNGT